MSGGTVRCIGVALAALILFVAEPTAALAAGSGDCDVISGFCEVRDVDPVRDPDPPKAKGVVADDAPPEISDCSAFVGEASDDIPSDVENPEDYVQIACMEGDIAITLWVARGPNVGQIARSLLAQVQLRPIEIGLVPRGADAMTVVGMPVWLWVDEPSRTTWGPATISAGGVTLTARVHSVTWDMGDGTTFTCGKGTEWKRGMGGDPSPTCGHTYEEQGSYTIRARSHWVATWSGYGQSGTIPLTLSSSRQLDVGEVQVIVTDG